MPHFVFREEIQTSRYGLPDHVRKEVENFLDSLEVIIAEEYGILGSPGGCF